MWYFQLRGSTHSVSDLENKHMFPIAKKVGSTSKNLGASLGMDHYVIERIHLEAPNMQYATWNMLTHWRDNVEGSVDRKKAELTEAVKEVDRHDLINIIQ